MLLLFFGESTVIVSGSISSEESFGTPVIYSFVKLYPNGDLSVGDWVTQDSQVVNLWATVDETSTSDTDYIELDSEPNPSESIFSIENADDPSSHVFHKVFYRIRKDGPDSISLTVTLLQGSTVIASWVETPTATWQDIERTLLESEATEITDYKDLRLSFEGVID